MNLNSNQTDETSFDPKQDLPLLRKFEIKYGCEGLE
jgi:hypothetical protein